MDKHISFCQPYDVIVVKNLNHCVLENHEPYFVLSRIKPDEIVVTNNEWNTVYDLYFYKQFNPLDDRRLMSLKSFQDIALIRYDAKLHSYGVTFLCVFNIREDSSNYILRGIVVEIIDEMQAKVVQFYDRYLNEGKGFSEMNSCDFSNKTAIDILDKIQSDYFNKFLNRMPVITRLIVDKPAVVACWSDNTKTVSRMMDEGEHFDPEIGLAMCISKKYYEILGFPYPRSAFKNQVENAYYKKDKTNLKKKTESEEK